MKERVFSLSPTANLKNLKIEFKVNLKFINGFIALFQFFLLTNSISRTFINLDKEKNLFFFFIFLFSYLENNHLLNHLLSKKA